MHPSSKCIGNTSFYNSNQPRTNSFGNYNQENHSKPSQFHHYSHYIQDQPIIPELFLKQPQPQSQQFTNDHNYHTTVIVNSTLKTTSVHSTMEKSSYNESRVIPENISLKAGKRSSKKDRHSKINTARGPRDRRMRLSLDVAKKFFKLQDMLGFDKASNTIQWLLMKSKPAIRNLQLNQSCSLMGVLNSASSPSDCEVLSGIDDQSIEKTGEEQAIIIDKADFNSLSCNKEKKKLDRVVRKSSYMHHSLAKETREKARARARKRTTEKRNIKLGYDQYSKLRPQPDHIIDQNTNRLGSWIPYGESQVQTKTNQTLYPSSDFQFKQGIVGDNSSMISNNWSPSFLFSYQHNPGSYHEHHLTDFQILGKPWEGLNN